MNYSEYRKLELSISKELNNWFCQFCIKNPEYKSIESLYLKKEVHLNGVQFVAGFQSYSGELDSWNKFISIPVAIELAMIWAYKTNRILDYKQEVWDSKEKITDTVLEHDLILSCILKIMEESKLILGEEYYNTHKYIYSFIRDLPIGFLVEKERLNIHNSSLIEIEKNWQHNYILRNIYFDALYDFAPMLGYLVASKIDIIPSYINKIAVDKRFSHVGQIINDLSDCIPEHDSFVKSYQDQCADIRNGIITYPIFQLIDNPIIINALKDSKTTQQKEWQEDFFNIIKDKKIDEEVIKIARDCYSTHVNFWVSVTGKENNFIERIYGLLLENKYLKKFSEDANHGKN